MVQCIRVLLCVLFLSGCASRYDLDLLNKTGHAVRLRLNGEEHTIAPGASWRGAYGMPRGDSDVTTQETFTIACGSKVWVYPKRYGPPANWEAPYIRPICLFVVDRDGLIYSGEITTVYQPNGFPLHPQARGAE